MLQIKTDWINLSSQELLQNN